MQVIPGEAAGEVVMRGVGDVVRGAGEVVMGAGEGAGEGWWRHY